MHLFVGIVAVALILVVLGDAFETIILPRRVTRPFRLTRIFYRNTWIPWRTLAARIRKTRRREMLLSFYGPLSLIVLLLTWALLMIVGFAALQWACGSGLATQENRPASFALMVYDSGTNFTTLGLGDVHPTTGIARFLTALEGGTGFGFLAIVIGYLPVIYQSFSRREVHISLLDARAGSPPAAVELIRRHAESLDLAAIASGLHEWEHWAAELLESHISYPVLALFRSQHANESWVSALTTIMDTCSLLMVGLQGIPARQAQLTFAMARHAAVDLAQILNTAPQPPENDRLPPQELRHLRGTLARYGVRLRDGDAADARLAELRQMYEPYVNALAKYLLLQLPPWFPSENAHDNWQTSAWERAVRRLPPAEAVLPDDHL